MEAALSTSSIASYRRSWALFSEFTDTVGLQNSFPVSISTMALFIAFLVEQGYRPATVSSYISAIGYMHKIQNIADPTGSFVVVQLLKSVHKSCPSADTRLPIDKCLLDKLVAGLLHVVPARYDRCLFSAMFMIAFHAFLRIGEITSRSPKAHNPHLLQLSDVELGAEQFTIHFKSFKHSQGKTFSLAIKRSSNSQSCPLQSLQVYLALRGTKAGPLFCQQSGSPVPRREFDNLLQRTLVFIQVNPRSFKGHSFRIGAASWAAAQGFSEISIKQMGRWKSDAYKKYIRNTHNVSAL